MALTEWNPATRISRGNVAVGVVPTIANINSPTVAELDAGLSLDCSITTFNGTSSVDSETVDWLYSPQSEQLPGTTTHSIDDLTIKATGQDDEQLIQGLKIGETVYIWRRDGLGHDKKISSGQKVWIWKATITSIDPLEGSNTYLGILAHVNVQARTSVPVAVK